jgi:hypothetical protein
MKTLFKLKTKGGEVFSVIVLGENLIDFAKTVEDSALTIIAFRRLDPIELFIEEECII